MQIKILVSVLLMCAFVPFAHAATVRRLALDIGSDAINIRIADVDEDGGRIDSVLVSEDAALPVLRSLRESGTGVIDAQINEQMVKIVKTAVAEARELGAVQYAAVATGALVQAKNAESVLKKIRDAAGIEVTLVDPDEEARLAFQAVVGLMTWPANTLLVWDLGGGSMEFVSAAGDQYAIYSENKGANDFKSRVIAKVKHQNPQAVVSPNPLTDKQLSAVVALARKQADELPDSIKAKVAEPATILVGIGALAFLKIEGKGPTYSLSELRSALSALAGKTDKELGDASFVTQAVTNLAFAIGFMEALDARKITLYRLNLANGLLLSSKQNQELTSPKGGSHDGTTALCDRFSRCSRSGL